jgi:hypothetical protein
MPTLFKTKRRKRFAASLGFGLLVLASMGAGPCRGGAGANCNVQGEGSLAPCNYGRVCVPLGFEEEPNLGSCQ